MALHIHSSEHATVLPGLSVETDLYMKPFLLVLLITLGPAGLGVVYADSDGYYCVGPGYLAYQFGMDTRQGPPPRLYVIRTSGPKGIPQPVALELPRFQVHGMRCGAAQVDVASFTAVYQVILDNEDRPVRFEVRPSPAGQTLPQEFILAQLQNLGSSSRAVGDLKEQRVLLAEKEGGGQYLLVIVPTVIPPVNRCETSITTRIVETDRNGREIGSRLIFRGRGRRECGE